MLVADSSNARYSMLDTGYSMHVQTRPKAIEYRESNIEYLIAKRLKVKNE